jgi:glycosyltransferase involved in cell wall biosynthesis
MKPVREQTSITTPKLSVALVTYNHEPFIAQAIESVLMQETDFPIELVIGEDCSKDATRDIVMSYAARYPAVVRALPTKQNLGLNQNYRGTIGACRGQYIALLEGDDYWVSPRKLQQQIRLMDEHPDWSMCGSACQFIIVNPDGKEQVAGVIQPGILKPCYGLTDFLEAYDMHTSTILLKRGLLEWPVWLDELLAIDTSLFALHAEKGPAGYLNEITSVYRGHGGGLWIGKSPIDRCRADTKALELLDAHFKGRFHRLLRRREGRNALGAVRQLLENGRPTEARNFYWEAACRTAVFMPLTFLGWWFRVYGHRWITAWNHFTASACIRTRLKNLSKRWLQWVRQ